MVRPDDIVANERIRRPVRRVGAFPGGNSGEALNDGRMIRTPMKFALSDGLNIDVWAINRGGATLTTGSIVEFSGTFYGRWMR